MSSSGKIRCVQCSVVRTARGIFPSIQKIAMMNIILVVTHYELWSFFKAESYIHEQECFNVQVPFLQPMRLHCIRIADLTGGGWMRKVTVIKYYLYLEFVCNYVLTQRECSERQISTLLNKQSEFVSQYSSVCILDFQICSSPSTC